MNCRFFIPFLKVRVKLTQIFYSRIDTPFTLLKQVINNTFSNLTFDPTVFPVPAENRLSFCNNLDTSSIDVLKNDLVKVARYGTIAIICLALILVGLNCLLIWYKWRSMKGHLERTRQAWVSDPVLNPNRSSESSPSAPQVIDHRENPSAWVSNPILNPNMSPSAPQVITLSDHQKKSSPWVSNPVLNPNRSLESSPSAPQVIDSDHNIMMSGGASEFSPSAPQVTYSDHNLTMSQGASEFSPPAPQVTHSDHNLMMPGGASEFSPSAPQVTHSDRNLMMSGGASEFSPSAPQVTHSNHNLMMPQGASESSPSAPQTTLSDHNLMMLQADSEHPLITRIMYLLAARTNMTPSQHIDMRWFFHYVFHPPALACFLIGFFGLLSVMIQLFLLGPLVSAARAGIDVAVSDLTKTIVNAINTTMYSQSAAYANDVNSKVDVVQNAINDGLFGWVNGTTTLLNTTINNFYTEVQNYVSHLFNGTVLEITAENFLQCVVGNKVADVEEALTFLNNNLFINIPRVSSDVLVLSPKTIDEATAPIASGAAGSGSSGDQGLLGSAVALYENSLRSEAVIFGIFMGLWGIVLVSAIVILLWRTHKRKKEAAAKRQRAILELQEKLKPMEEGNDDFSSSNDEKNRDLFMD